MIAADTVELVAMVAALWPGMKLTEGTPDVWHEVLGDLPLGDAQAAVRMLAKTHPGYIGPADIRKAVYDALGLLAGASPERALAAVVAVASNQGSGRGALEPLAARVYDALGGARVIADMPAGVLRREFGEMWQRLSGEQNNRLLCADFDRIVRKELR